MKNEELIEDENNMQDLISGLLLRKRIEIYENYNFKLYSQNLIVSSCQKEFSFPFEKSQLLHLKTIYLEKN